MIMKSPVFSSVYRTDKVPVPPPLAEIKPQRTSCGLAFPLLADSAPYQQPGLDDDDGAPDKSVKCLTQQPWRSFWGHPPL